MSGLDGVGWAVVITGALAGSVIGGVAGFGAGITLLPGHVPRRRHSGDGARRGAPRGGVQ